MAAQARQAARLASQAIPVDPAATSALQAAENDAIHASQPEAPSAVRRDEQGEAHAMDEASADLAGSRRGTRREGTAAGELVQMAGHPEAAAEAARLAQSLAGLHTASLGHPGLSTTIAPRPAFERS